MTQSDWGTKSQYKGLELSEDDRIAKVTVKSASRVWLSADRGAQVHPSGPPDDSSAGWDTGGDC